MSISMHTCVVAFMALEERKSSGQKVDYGPSWKEQYPWVVSIQQDDGTVAELLCELCSQLNGTKQAGMLFCCCTAAICMMECVVFNAIFMKGSAGCSGPYTKLV